MKKLFVLLLIYCNIQLSFGQKAFDEYKVAKNFIPFTSYTSKALPTGAGDVMVNINTGIVLNTIPKSLFGQNAAAFQGNTSASGVREQNWKNAEFSMLRFPGGNWSNEYFWDGTKPPSIQYERILQGDVNQLFAGNSGWMLGTDEFPDFIKTMGSDGIVCVNVGYAFYGTSADPVETAATYAANWVKHYNVNLKAGIKYWELGNENFGPWQAGFDLSTPQKYAEACKIFAQKMKAVDPTIKIGVNFFNGYGGFNRPQGKNWNELVLPIVQDIMDFAIIHIYPHPNINPNNISEKDIYDAVSVVDTTLTWFHAQTTTYTNKPAGYYPIAITEYNSRAGVRDISRTNALFTTMILGEFAKHKDYGAAMQWDLTNGYHQESGGTHGAVSAGDPFMSDGDPYPSLLAHYYMRRYFGNKLVSATSTNKDILVYPTTFTSGEMGLIVINKGANPKKVEINTGSNFSKGKRMYWHTINGDASDFDRTIYINDQGPGNSFIVGQTYTNGKSSAVATAYEANGVGGPKNYTDIKPYSALIPATGNIKFATVPYSVSYIVFEANNSSCNSSITSPSNSFCAGGSVVLTASTGASYKWFKGTTQVGTASTYTATTGGSYTVEVTNAAGCKATSAAKVITVNPLPTATISSPSNSFCQGGSVVLTSSAGASCKWFKGTTQVGTASTYTATTSGSYTVEVTNAAGCKATSAAKVITVNPLPTATISSPSNSFCEGGSVVLTSSAGASYKWFKGTTQVGTASTYTATIGGSYTVEVTNAAGCKATSAAKVITVNSLPESNCATSEIIGPDCAVPSQEIKFTLNSKERVNATNYNWWFGGSAATLAPSTDKTSCTIQLSKYYSTGQVCVGVNYKSAPYYKTYCKQITQCTEMTTLKTAAPTVVIYPNPCVADQVTITANSNDEVPHKIEISDSFGNILIKTEPTELQTVINMANLVQGTYSVKTYFNVSINVQQLLIFK